MIGIGIPFGQVGGGVNWTTYWATLISSTVENAAPANVVLTFPSAKSLVAADFTCTVNGSARTINSASWTGAVITLVLASNVVVGDAVVVTFVPSGGTTNVTNNVGEAEVILYLTGLTTPLSQATRVKINAIVTGLKTGLSISSLSDIDDCRYILAGETAESSLKNLVKNAHHGTAVNAPTFTAFEGFVGDGISSYIDTNYNPETQGSNFVLNSATIGIYCRTNSDSGTIEAGARIAYGNDMTYIQLRSTNVALPKINQDDSTGTHTFTNTDSTGMYVITRNNANSLIVYRNKVSVFNQAKTSDAVPSFNIYIGCVNSSGTAAAFSAKQISLLSLSKGVSSANSDVFTDVFEAYMDSNSKGVIA
jgi:hypothetical protein